MKARPEQNLESAASVTDRFFVRTSDLLCAFEPEGCFVRLSPGWARVLGFTVEELQSRPVLDFVHPDDRAAAREALAAAAAGAEASLLGRWACLHGGYRLLSLSLEASADDALVYGSARELVATDDADEDDARAAGARRAAARDRQLLDRVPDGVAVLRDRVVLHANPALVGLLGHAHPGAVLGRLLEELVHPDDRAALDAGLCPAEAGEGQTAGASLRLLARSGNTTPVDAVATAVEFDGGPAVLLFVRDATERREAQARLAEAARMVSIGTVAAGVAHEINNPLAYILANLACLAEELPALSREAGCAGGAAGELEARLEELGRLAVEARAGAERVRDIVRDLKTLSRPEADRRGPVDLRAVLDATLQMARNEIRHRARLVRTFEDVPPVEGNDSRLAQVFLNLLVNAAQAIPEGDAAGNEVRVVVRRADDGARVAVEISDTGQGIAREVADRIFDPFFTTKPAGVGTGLGLAICQSIVAGHGGEIQVESEPGRGATFRVLLPARAAPVVRAVSARPDGAAPGARRLRILVVDDEPSIGRALARLLRGQHAVEVAGSGREALALLAADAGFDVVFCDVMMPDLTGVDLYERARATWPDLAARFVFLTGGAFTDRARQFLEAVPNRRLDKPFDMREIRALLAAVSEQG